MNCEYCGNKIFELDRSCPSCGASIKIPKVLFIHDTSKLLGVLSPNEIRAVLGYGSVYRSEIDQKENTQ